MERTCVLKDISFSLGMSENKYVFHTNDLRFLAEWPEIVKVNGEGVPSQMHKLQPERIMLMASESLPTPIKERILFFVARAENCIFYLNWCAV